MAIRWFKKKNNRSSGKIQGCGGREKMGKNSPGTNVVVGWEHIEGIEALVYCTYIPTGEDDSIPITPADFSWSVGWKC